METLTCPDCDSKNVTLAVVQKLMANTGEHYCYTTKMHDPYAQADCLDCGWKGERDDLNSNAD